jgi:hypothetical protein
MDIRPADGCSKAAGSRVYDGPILLSDGLPVTVAPKWLGVSHALSDHAKWIFILTNAPYLWVACLIATSDSIPASCSWHCLTGACTSPAFHGAMVLGLGLVSMYWHGAQSQLLPALYCPSPETGLPRLQSARWQHRLITGDIACSVLTFLVGVCCFGLARTVSWIAPALVLFVGGSISKRQKQYRRYAVLHGLWHLASALAIHQIVLSGTQFSIDTGW